MRLSDYIKDKIMTYLLHFSFTSPDIIKMPFP